MMRRHDRVESSDLLGLAVCRTMPGDMSSSAELAPCRVESLACFGVNSGLHLGCTPRPMRYEYGCGRKEGFAGLHIDLAPADNDKIGANSTRRDDEKAEWWIDVGAQERYLDYSRPHSVPSSYSRYLIAATSKSVVDISVHVDNATTDPPF